MAHYVPIPKDLNDIKEKFIMGFTKRQVICFGIGLVLGAPVYFLTRASIGMSGRINEYLRITIGTDEQMHKLIDFLKKYLNK